MSVHFYSDNYPNSGIQLELLNVPEESEFDRAAKYFEAETHLTYDMTPPLSRRFTFSPMGAKRSPFKTGKYVECYAPIGCRKSAEDKCVLEIDPVTAPVVRRILDMHLQDDSFRKIARTLNKERVPSPRNFYYMAEGRSNLRGETPYWNDVTVKTIF